MVPRVLKAPKAPKAPRTPKALKNQKFIFQNKKEEEEKMTTIEFKDYNEDESTQDDSQSSCYSWIGVSRTIDIKGEKRSWDKSKEEEENGGQLFNRNHLPKLRLLARALLAKKLKKKMMTTTMTIMIKHKHKPKYKTKQKKLVFT